MLVQTILSWHQTGGLALPIVLRISIGVVQKAKTIDVFPTIGSAMASKIVKMVVTNLVLVQNEFVQLDNSNVATNIVS